MVLILVFRYHACLKYNWRLKSSIARKINACMQSYFFCFVFLIKKPEKNRLLICSEKNAPKDMLDLPQTLLFLLILISFPPHTHSGGAGEGWGGGGVMGGAVVKSKVGELDYEVRELFSR